MIYNLCMILVASSQIDHKLSSNPINRDALVLHMSAIQNRAGHLQVKTCANSQFGFPLTSIVTKCWLLAGTYFFMLFDIQDFAKKVLNCVGNLAGSQVSVEHHLTFLACCS